MKNIFRRIGLPQVVAILAVALVLGSGTAYAAKQITSKNIKNNTIKSVDVKDGALTGTDVSDGSLTTLDVATDTLTAADLAANSVDTGEIVDFGLTNQDVGVLFAQVNADGTLANSSGGVTSAKVINPGGYAVDFGRDISNCAFNATIGPFNTATSTGLTAVADRSGNLEAVYVDTMSTAGAFADRPFQLIVVC